MLMHIEWQPGVVPRTTLGLLLKVGWNTVGDVNMLPYDEAAGRHVAATAFSPLRSSGR